jgi:protoporphyrinogen oxidase
MLKAKFDAGFDNVPATWIWSRLVRMKSTREGANQKEMAGHLIGGYITLIKAMTEKIKELGGEVLLKTPVKEIVIEDGKATGIRMVNDEL